MKEQSKIQQRNWQQFTCTGKIEDYLRYTGSCKEGEEPILENHRQGEHPYAGIYNSNRNYIEADAYRGI